MKIPRILVGIVFLLSSTLLIRPLSAAEENDEQKQIQILQSNASPAEKDAACARLKRIGTTRCVPALASLLNDESLSHSARYVLESLPYAEAGKALVDAVNKSSGMAQVGIVNSLAFRREAAALPVLVQLLSNPANTEASWPLAQAAANAIGRIGGTQALQSLQAAAKTFTNQVHAAVIDGILCCAQDTLESGNGTAALEAFKAIYQDETIGRFRIAAYRGMIRAAGDKGTELLIQGITGQENAAQIASVQMVHEIATPQATIAISALLPQLPPQIQIAVTGGLAQRDDVAASPAIARLSRSPVLEVRVCALNALGILGDAPMVPELVQSAATTKGEEQASARQALGRIRRGDVTGQLLGLLNSNQPEIQAEAARALGDRGDAAAVPKLVELAQTGSDSVRKPTLQALALLAGVADLKQLVGLVSGAGQDAARTQAAQTLNSVCTRLQSRYGRVDVQPLVDGLSSGSPESRVALLSCCSSLTDAKIRTALRTALAENDLRIRSAAARAICETTDAELLPDLRNLACTASDESLRSLAIAGCVRLATQEESVKLNNDAKTELFRAILATSLRPEQKRRVLGGLADVPDPQALKLAAGFLREEGVSSEAVRAVIKIAPTLSAGATEAAMDALKQALSVAADEDSRKSARTALNQLEANASYLTSWQVAGPFTQSGKDFAALFDVAFPPEEPEVKTVKWQALPAGTDPTRPWLMDLLKVLGGEQRVAYARTWVYSNQAQPSRLELGSDDGVKVWLNHKLVYANNIARPIQAGSDHADVSLQQGWNELLFKVTQNNQGWEFCARLLKPDGTFQEGLKCSASKELTVSQP